MFPYTCREHPAGALRALHPPGLGVWQGAGLAGVCRPEHSPRGLEDGVDGVVGGAGEAGEGGRVTRLPGHHGSSS